MELDKMNDDITEVAIKKAGLSTGAIVAIVIVGIVVVSVAIALGVVFGSPKAASAAAPASPSTTPPANTPATPPPATPPPATPPPATPPASTPKVQFFTECNYGGTMTEKESGTYTWPTTIKSIKIPSNMELRIEKGAPPGDYSVASFSAHLGAAIEVPCTTSYGMGGIPYVETGTRTVKINPVISTCVADSVCITEGQFCFPSDGSAFKICTAGKWKPPPTFPTRT